MEEFPGSNLVSQQPILVTGATGFIASHLVQQLLQRGYRVRGTIRSLKNKEKYEHLLKFDVKGDHLELVEADLMNQEGFDKAVPGCEYVIHTASPYILTVNDPQKDLVDPAVQGTLNVLRACVNHGQIKKVVLTSSVAAITDSPECGHVYTEADWNKESSLTRNPYYYSKTVAEQEAWKFVEQLPEKKFNLVVINPFVVVGPEYNSTGVNSSNSILQGILTSKFPAVIDLSFTFVDVRDVALAHILALENPSAQGRYLCANATLSMKETCDLLRPKYPNCKIPCANLTSGLANFVVKVGSFFGPSGNGQYLRSNIGRKFEFDNSKIVKELGINWRPLEETLFATCDDLIARNMADSKH